MNTIYKIFILIFFIGISNVSYAKNIENIIINGNERVSDDTIIMFSEVNIGDDLLEIDLNSVLKNIYKSNFFENVTVEIEDKNLNINVVEYPIIQNVEIKGIKAKKNLELVKKNLILKPRSSLNNYLINQEKQSIISLLRSKGYYFAEVQMFSETLDNNMVNLIYEIELGNKGKIKKINFLGNKIFKENKLKSVIISEEYKPWKFISGRKYLNQETISLDKRLLKNFFLNKGFYNVEINSSFAKLVKDDEFELTFNINAGEKIFFNNLMISLPADFQRSGYANLEKLFLNIKGEPYSINLVEKILDKIDLITLNEEFKSINAEVEEDLIDNKLDLNFVIKETEKYFVEKINIFGNNVTRESVIRNRLNLDEGDPYNEILRKKSENNIKSLNFFRTVKTEVAEGKTKDSKVINIFIEEKPTGEIFAGAGAGTDGATITAGVKENNYLGKGLRVEANGTLTEETFKGKFAVTNPNFNNSNKSVFANIQALEIDQMKNYGYKTNKTGFELGTGFEYLEDFRLGLSTRSFFEKIETDSTASARQKSQAGNYWDTFIKINFDYDKRNQKFKPSDGFRSFYSLDIPVISDNNTLTNTYDYKFYTELYENNISSLSILLKSANSITGDDVKLTERLIVPYSRLRGFEKGKIGPKDGDDFIGGNYVTALNLSSNVPFIFPNIQNLDAAIFFDAANVWGVDYDSTLGNGDKLRSSIGFGIDWFTVIGPMSFTFSEAITKDSSDIEETFRFNIGTTF
ncbi:outer membrane protein assembly factor BamA [Candidatus Pelagibacter sp. FZCC0015]|uniref:outer membrane protein assembly factor BamA n=1 Tax=Candidatus Pelagibacter sp. FZCC0015 TaxID=2268451 RepID=UPI00197AF0FA|nr:outer membrane protein assembly factor BamA [Candidatus Pelagibacter sp. FZCC0015]